MVRGCLAVLLLLHSSALAAGGVQVAEFSPRGTVKDVRQATARFSAPVVPLGDPRLQAPFAVECGIGGSGRWLDSRTWVYDFERDLPAGIRCSFTLVDDLAALDGAAITGNRVFAFDTGGPSVRSSIPYAGNESIDEDQAFVLVVDAEPSESSVLEHVWFSVTGLPEKVGVRVLGGGQRKAILDTLEEWEVGGPAVVVQARQKFPSEAVVQLTWGAGVATAGGLATTQDQVFEFTTRSAFRAHLLCERQNENSGCVPFLPVRLALTAPVAWEVVAQAALFGPGGERWGPQPPDPPEPTVSRLSFQGPFPEKAKLRLELPADLRDDSGRTLVNDAEYPLVVETAEDPALAKFSSRFGIIESTDPVLPVTIRNLEADAKGRKERVSRERQSGLRADLARLVGRVFGRAERIEAPEDVLPWLRRVGSARRTKSVFSDNPVPSPQSPAPKIFTLPQPEGPRPLQVVGIPLASTGLHIVELSSQKLGAALLGRDQPVYVATAALVTNLAVHFKWGRDNSLVWVTALEDARPVAGAHVAVQDCAGVVLWSGVTNDDGVALASNLPRGDQTPRCQAGDTGDESEENPDYYDDFSDAEAINPYALTEGLLITAQTADDLSFVHTSWDDGIQPWRFQLPPELAGSEVAAHTILDRPLFRTGETVHMKHVLRAATLEGFGFVPAERRPDKMEILHLGSSDRYELPLAWSEDGSAETIWQIPSGAKLGQYEVMLRRAGSEPWHDRWSSGGFRVEEFRIPLMRGAVQLPAAPQVQVSEVPVEVSVSYLAGGPASGVPVRLRALVRQRYFTSPLQFEHFTFANGDVPEGRGPEAEPDADAGKGPAVHQREDLTLDAGGAARTTVRDIPASSGLRELLAEAEYRDPNGELQTISSTVTLWPARWLVGIEAQDWAGSTKKIGADLAVVDEAGRPVAGAPVRLDVKPHTTYSYRKRLVGGFYAYEHIDEVGPVLSTVCQGTTDTRGRLRCEGPAPVPEELILVASARDPAGNESFAHSQVFVTGDERLWFRVGDSDRIDVLPEKPEYDPGETARFQVRMPFAAATALVTAEREGILDARVVHLEGKDPVIEIPVAASFSPNIYISVLAVRGRVAGIAPTAMVDLGKPAFKLGIGEIRVGWQPHTLKVEVETDRPVYRVREKAAVKVRVRTAAGAPPPAGSEIALAAVDEGLLELQPNTSWNLLARMMGRRGYGVRTSTAQMQVVGKRHYGLKSRPEGGGGGRQTTRELFETLLLWRGRIALDANGEATAEVPLNDSLTAFRIAAVATAGAQLFGDGGVTIRSTQDLMLLSGLSPLVREGDRFRAALTLRNTTAAAMDVRLSAKVAGLGRGLEEQMVPLAAGEAKVVGWDVVAPVGVKSLRYEIEAAAGASSDRLALTQRVEPAVPVRTLQATLFRWEKAVQQDVEAPAGALPGRGGVDVGFAPTLAVGLDGVRQWMEAYPYTCLEQRVSRAVALRDEALWQQVVSSLPSHLDGDGLLKYFPRLTAGSEVLTAYVLSIAQAAGLSLPADAQQRIEEGLTRFIQGSITRPSSVGAADMTLRKLAALAALARVGKVTPELLTTLAVEPNLWPTSALLDWWTVLRRLPAGGKAAPGLTEAERILQARLDLQGTRMGFSNEERDGLWWLMICPDANAARLVEELTQAKLWRDDLPRLVRGLMQRQQRGHWDCTTSNAWGTVAVEKFATAFEATPVSGVSTAALGGETQEVHWTQPPAAASLTFAWPDGAGRLAIDHRGAGNPWVTVQSRAALPLTEPLFAGYRVSKTVEPVESRTAGKYSAGDVLRLRLEVEAQAEMTWVVVADPIPAGASHLGTGLGRDSQIATAGESTETRIQPAYVERPFDAYRAYYELVPKGRLVAEYTIRLNQGGTFQLPPTRVEALYAPEMFGEIPNPPMVVEP